MLVYSYFVPYITGKCKYKSLYIQLQSIYSIVHMSKYFSILTIYDIYTLR